MRDATIEWVSAVADRRGIDLGVIAEEGARSPTVTAVRLPAGMSTKDVRESINGLGFTVGGGYGQLSDTTFRVGHMGDHSLDGIRRCLHACETAIAELAERRSLARA
jgi:aspartate aminotransferase-like enzyme